MNVLLTSAGRRSYLVNYFKKALGKEGKVLVCNSIDRTPAMDTADMAFIVPYVYEESYLEELLKIISQNNVHYIFSLHDLDGPILSKNREHIESYGAKLIMPDQEIINVCLDKYKSFKFLKERGVSTPETWLSPKDYYNNAIDKSFPLIIKPRWGFGSINILKAWSDEDVEYFFKYFESQKDKRILNYLGHHNSISSTIIQQYQSGDEFGLGVVNDLNKKFAGNLKIKKMGMRSGETDSAVVVNDEKLEELGIKLSHTIGHIGLLDVDVIKNSERYYVIELNPRFGGQYPFSHCAGANVPEFLMNIDEVMKLPKPGMGFYKDITLKSYL